MARKKGFFPPEEFPHISMRTTRIARNRLNHAAEQCSIERLQKIGQGGIVTELIMQTCACAG